MSANEKNTERLHLRITPTVRKKLDILSRKSKLSLSRTVELLIEGKEIREVPPIDFYRLCEEMRAIGRNFNQVVRLAHLSGNINHMEYARHATEINKKISEIWQEILYSP